MKHFRSIWLLILTLLVACSSAPPTEHTAQHQERLYQQTPTGAAATYQYVGQNGVAAGKTLTFGLWLPTGYSEANGPYPVIYWFHGKDSSHTQSISAVLPYIKTAIQQGKLRPSIVVMPNAGPTSFYSNNCDNSWPVEDLLLELVSHIDQETYSYADGDHRLVAGFSMGAFGALKFASKYPSMFAGVAGHAGPRLDANFGGPWLYGDATIFQNVFCGSQTIYEQNTPTYWYSQNKPTILSLGLVTYLTVGANDPTKSSVNNFNNKLVAFGIPRTYPTPYANVGHVVTQLLTANNGAGFQALNGSMPAP